MSKTIVFGASGQLGSCIKAVAEHEGRTDIVFLAEGTANILDVENLLDIFNEHKPQYVINCAAYTAVDKAEEEGVLASRINTDGASHVADLCKAFEATLIHISTDFVYGGKVASLILETDRANPLSIYGVTKFEGDSYIYKSLEAYFIIRTSWLYSEYGNNFVKTMLKLGSERDELKVIVDQVGTPTYAIDLAKAIFKVIDSESKAYGIYHYSNEGAISWYDFAQAIFQISNTQVKVLPITTAEYPAKAIRPAFTVLSKAKFKKTFDTEIPYWRDSLEACIKQLNHIHNHTL